MRLASIERIVRQDLADVAELTRLHPGAGAG